MKRNITIPGCSWYLNPLQFGFSLLEMAVRSVFGLISIQPSQAERVERLK
ncbi:hypothetical protein OAB11_02395 [Verrucomicrobia bacterium]|nr:hypothetical protein [Verrucomicrobiota bacterium]